ncbi:energy transducer TonB [Sphingomonas sp. R86520]|uniref:energy transducer TonB n=1 Tax=Sphingomonas sp. R86520 TaxID=3093859 RepID=UPI0036D3B6DC
MGGVGKRRMTMFRATLSFALMVSAGTVASAQLVSVQLDYPATALRARAEGVVGFEVKLAKDGTVTGCRVTQTSGRADLDQQTCNQLRKTARFKPAVDAAGKPIASKYAGRLRWQLPRSAQATVPAVVPR